MRPFLTFLDFSVEVDFLCRFLAFFPDRVNQVFVNVLPGQVTWLRRILD